MPTESAARYREAEPTTATTASLARLAALLEYTQDADSPVETRRGLARERLRELRATASELDLEAGSGVDGDPVSEATYRRLFARAVLIWTHFADVVGPDSMLLTFRSDSLHGFPVDLPNDPRTRAAVREALDLDPHELAALDEELAPGLKRLAGRRRISAILRSRLLGHMGTLGALGETGDTGDTGDTGETKGLRPTPASCLALMKSCYGEVPLRLGEVDVVLTATSLLFIISNEEEALAARSAESEDATGRVRKFFRDLRLGDQAMTDRFPSFGALDRDAIDATLIAALATGQAAPETRVVRDELAAMISILERDHAEQYLLHDLWGHGWQGIFFDDLAVAHGALGRLSEPLSPGSGPRTHKNGAGALRLRDAFLARSGHTELEDKVLERFVEADLAERVAVGLQCLMAEVFADLVEGKFIRLAAPCAEAFPSSSLLPEEPLKLDLVLRDLQNHLRLVGQPYADLAHRPAALDGLLSALLAEGFPLPGLHASAKRAATLAASSAEALLRDDLTATSAKALFGQLALLAASLDRALAPYWQAATAVAPAARWRHPEGCIDLLVIVLACYGLHDPLSGYRFLPALLAHRLPATLARFGASLRKLTA